MKATDEQLKEAWERLRNGAAVGRELNMSAQAVLTRIHRLRASGVELPPPEKAGHFLTPERAREISKLSKHPRKEG